MTSSFAIPLAETRRLEFETAFAAHKDEVFGWALRYAAGDRAFAEDLTHDVFLKLWESQQSLAARGDVGGWLYTVTAHLAVTRLRKKRGLLQRLHQLVSRDVAPATDVVVEAKLSAQAALASLATLPDRERIALCMHLLDGLSQREVAKAMKLSEGYVSKLLSRGRQRLDALGWEVSSP